MMKQKWCLRVAFFAVLGLFLSESSWVYASTPHLGDIKALHIRQKKDEQRGTRSSSGGGGRSTSGGGSSHRPRSSFRFHSSAREQSRPQSRPRSHERGRSRERSRSQKRSGTRERSSSRTKDRSRSKKKSREKKTREKGRSKERGKRKKRSKDKSRSKKAVKRSKKTKTSKKTVRKTTKIKATSKTSKTLALRASRKSLGKYASYRSSHAGFGLGLAVGSGLGLVVGASFGAFATPWNVGFWGSPFFYPGVPGCWFYPRFGCWFNYSLGWWFFPWSLSWYYPHPYFGYWYYPSFGINLYLTNERERIYVVENESRDESYFAVYFRQPLDGGGYYLYRVNEPRVVSGNQVFKVYVPQDEDEYVILVNRDRGYFKESLIQDVDGEVVEPEADDIQPVPEDVEQKIEMDVLDEDEQEKLGNMKREIKEKRTTLNETEESVKRVDTTREKGEELDEKAAKFQMTKTKTAVEE